MSEHDQLCEASSNIQRNCYCQQRRERIYIEALESERDDMKEIIVKLNKALRESMENSDRLKAELKK